MIDVAFATYGAAPGLDPDEAGLGEACARLGLRWEARPWDSPWDPRDARAVVLRSPWNYSRRRDEFLAWCRRVSAATRLLNPLDVVERNTEKSYLVDLAARGVPVVPTLLHDPRSDASLDDILRDRDWPEVVVKPAVSAGGWRTFRLRRGESTHDHVRARRLLRTRRCLVQPFLPSVLGSGERALVFLDGRFSHAIRKRSVFDPEGGPFRVPVEPAPEELALAEQALRAEGADDLLYARVDLVRDESGAPRLIELELTEPRLFLGAAGSAACDALAAGIARRL